MIDVRFAYSRLRNRHKIITRNAVCFAKFYLGIDISGHFRPYHGKRFRAGSSYGVFVFRGKPVCRLREIRIDKARLIPCVHLFEIIFKPVFDVTDFKRTIAAFVNVIVICRIAESEAETRVKRVERISARSGETKRIFNRGIFIAVVISLFYYGEYIRPMGI